MYTYVCTYVYQMYMYVCTYVHVGMFLQMCPYYKEQRCPHLRNILQPPLRGVLLCIYKYVYIHTHTHTHTYQLWLQSRFLSVRTVSVSTAHCQVSNRILIWELKEGGYLHVCTCIYIWQNEVHCERIYLCHTHKTNFRIRAETVSVVRGRKFFFCIF